MENISLDNKKILIVDDEPDILDTLEELLSTSKTVRARTFEEASKILENEDFDIAVLDIMGVDGYKLLEKANRKNIPTVMLTANALSPDNIKKSCEGGACSYIPKQEMSRIDSFLIDVLKARKEGKNPWTSWYKRLESFLDDKFGTDWDKDQKKFWEKISYY
jgi:DNA-binding NtrC family response regulator